MTPCPCGLPAKYQCHRCHRCLCHEHYALGSVEMRHAPKTIATVLHGVTVCMPVCDAQWWRALKEGKEGATP